MRPIVALAVPSILATFVACQKLVPIEGAPKRSVDAAVDAGAEVDAQVTRVVSACDPISLIENTVIDGSNRNEPITLALSYVGINPSNAAKGIDVCTGSAGFDLDGKTTCFSDGGPRDIKDCRSDPVRCAWGPSCNPRLLDDNQCDETADGADNALGKLIANIGSSLLSFVASSFDPVKYLQLGQINALIRIDGYNGEANDPHVSVSFVRSSGLLRDSERVPDGGREIDERWDGTSLREWCVDPSSADSSGELKKGKPAEGHVVNYVLYASSDELDFPVMVPVTLHKAKFAAQLRRATDDRWVLTRGRLGARIKRDDVMLAIANTPVGSAKGVSLVCKGPYAEGIKNLVCPALDLSTEGGDCDEMSVAFAFTAVPAVLGPVRAVIAPDGGCEDAEVPKGCP